MVSLPKSSRAERRERREAVISILTQYGMTADEAVAALEADRLSELRRLNTPDPTALRMRRKERRQEAKRRAQIG